MTLAEAILRAARNLRIPIPSPAIPAPKEQASFHQLKPGQQLRNIVEIQVGDVKVSRGSQWKVAKCFSDGAVLEYLAGAFIVTFRQADPNWKGRFERAKGKRK